MPRNAAAAGKQVARKAPKAHTLAIEFPKGLMLTDMFKKDWKLGDVIGQGGFGLIYLASKGDSKPVTKATAENVIKIEPKGNGPLYCEMHFYQRAAKQADVQEFIRQHKLHYLSVPPYVSAGIHTHQSKDYRFLVMPRCGTDLQHLLADHGGTFPPHTVFAVGLRMVDAMEYIHSKDFVHADIKAANILLGYKDGKERRDQVYLVDFGLATKFSDSGTHRDYTEDPRRAHDGTIEFTSRDAHRGVVPSRRSDVEILSYCMLQWLCGRLPWETNLKDPNSVAASKERHMKKVPGLISECFSTAPSRAVAHAPTIQQFMEEAARLSYEAAPSYDKLRSILRSGLSRAGHKDEWSIGLETSKTPGKRNSSEQDIPPPQPAKQAKQTVPKKKADGTSGGAKKKPTQTKDILTDTRETNLANGGATPPPAKVARSPRKKKTTPPSSSSTHRMSLRTSPPKPHNGSLPLPSRPKKTDNDAGRSSSKVFQMPPPSKGPSKTDHVTTQKRRVVRRTKTDQSDASIQTSPMMPLQTRR